MGRHSEYRGGIYMGIDGFCRTPLHPALDARFGYEYFEHFFPIHGLAANTLSGWTVTELTSGDFADGAEAGGWLSTVLTVDAQGQQAQSDGVWVLPAAGKEIWFEASLKLTDADDIDWMIGLAATDTNIFSTDPTELIVFRGDDGDANIDFHARDGGAGAAADTTVDTADGTAIRVGFYVNGVTSVTPYVNGTAYTAVTSGIPTSAVRLTFGSLGGATTNPNHLKIDWMRLLSTV